MNTTYEAATTTPLRTGELGACALVQDLLPLYLEGEVSPGSRDLITEHLAGCERCAGFMAGAQTVRAQLRRDGLQRATSVQQDAPVRGAVLRWRAALASAAALVICVIGGVASIGLGASLRYGGDRGPVGVFIGLCALAALLVLARVVGPFSVGRVSRLGMSVGAGIVAGLLLMGATGPVIGLVGFLAFVATGAVCWQLGSEAAALPIRAPR
jgi:predicted anti-sigma-YlaC factor YlaD